MKLKDEILFVNPGAEGLDSDTDLKYMPPGHSPVDIDRDQLGRLNCRSGLTKGGVSGSVENILGTKEIVDSAAWNGTTFTITTGGFSLPAGTNKALGEVEDIENNGIIWANYNSNNNHTIYRYLSNEDAVEIILQDALLGFDPNYLIHKMVLIGDTLLWTDNNVEPKSINIKAAVNHTVGSRVHAEDFQYPVTLTAQDIDMIRYPPADFAQILFGTDFNFDYNNLRGKLFKFAYKWVYFDNSKSVMNTPSKTQLPANEELINGDWRFDNSINNYIEIQYESGPEAVVRIELFVKEGDDGIWRKYITFDKYDTDWNYIIDPSTGLRKIDSNDDIIYRFYNEKFGEAADQDDVARLYDNVPKRAGAITLVEDNRSVFGDCTIGFDSVNLSVKTRYQNVTRDVIPYTLPDGGLNGINVSLTGSGAVHFIQLPLIGNVALEDVLVLHIRDATSPVPDPGNWFTFYYRVLTLTNYPNNAVDSFIDQINNATGTHMSAGTGMFIGAIYFSTTAPYFYPYSAYGFQYTAHNKYRTFKKGQLLPFGLMYGDGKGRWGSVNISEDLIIPKSTMSNFVSTTTIYSPFNTEFGSVDDTVQRVVDWEINHSPPSWASYYQWVFAPHQFNYIKMYVSGFAQDLVNYPGKILIDINVSLQDMRAKLPKCILSDYVWQKGDYVRFMSQPIDLQTNTVTPIATYLNFEIEGLATGTAPYAYEAYLIIPEFEFSIVAPYSPYGVGRYCMVEIYTPEKNIASEDRTWYTFGEIGQILTDGNGNRYHALIRSDAVSQNQTFTAGGALIQGARGRFDGFDNYIHGRYTKFYEFAVEDKGYSDFFSSEVTDSGKVNLVLPDVQEKRYKSMIMHGGKYLLDTQINELSSFDLLGNSDILGEKYGQIRALRFKGYTLKVLQDKKNTSVYINRNILTLPDGSSDITRTTKVFSQINPAKEDWGTVNPESVRQHENSLYFLDVNAGKSIRDAGNGQFAISSYFMNKYFKGVSERATQKISDPATLSSTTPTGFFCPAYFVEQFDEYHLNIQLTYIEIVAGVVSVETTSETLYFSDAIVLGNRVNRWKSFMFDKVTNTVGVGASQLLWDYFGSNSLVSLAWQDGTPYKLEAGTDYCNFAGTKYKQKIAITANGKAPNSMKTFMSTQVRTNNNIHRESVTTTNWSVDDDGVYIPPSTQYPNGMLSRIKANNFVSKEGGLFAALGRDKTTPNGKSDTWNIVNGRELKGEVAEITFENESDDYVVISDIIVTSIDSKSGQ